MRPTSGINESKEILEMAERKLANGYILTDEEIETRAQAWEGGAWKGQLIEMRADGLRLSSEPNANPSFKCLQSGTTATNDAVGKL